MIAAGDRGGVRAWRSPGARTLIKGGVMGVLGGQVAIVTGGGSGTPILDKRPLPPDERARATMMPAEEVARAIMLAVTLPPRTVIEEIVMSKDLEVARRAGAPAGARW
jgi:hypothetical protein